MLDLLILDELSLLDEGFILIFKLNAILSIMSVILMILTIFIPITRTRRSFHRQGPLKITFPFDLYENLGLGSQKWSIVVCICKLSSLALGLVIIKGVLS